MAWQFEERNDLHLTATGIGHEYRPEIEFPPDGFQRSVLDPLPPSIGNENEVIDHFKTTTGAAHNFKPMDTLLANPVYKKAAGHWNVEYVADNIKKLQVKPWRRALTMGNQCSEMKAQYQARPGVSTSRHFNSDTQPPVFRHHHKEGPLKEMVASTQNKAISGKLYHVANRGVLSHHSDLYLSTTQHDHRAFTSLERSKYPKKSYATYWECEGYPKAWGHGSKENPLPLHSVPREKGPMRDSTWFKTPTIVPRRPKSMQPVPHHGLVSEVRDKYQEPSADYVSVMNSCPIDTPWHLKAPGAEEIYSVPKMYHTEYEYYGSGRPIAV